jgi:hypothetical protein
MPPGQSSACDTGAECSRDCVLITAQIGMACPSRRATKKWIVVRAGSNDRAEAVPARPFRLTPPPIPERSIHETVALMLDKLVAPPAFWFSAAIGATKLTPQQAAALSRAGVKRGLPDLIVIHDTRIFGIELKAQGGRLSKTRVVRTKRGSPRVLVGQAEVFPALEAAGMVISVCRSPEAVLAQLEAWGVPLRGRMVAA